MDNKKQLTTTTGNGMAFFHFLHGEKNYDGLDALKNGIEKDVGVCCCCSVSNKNFRL